jgi:hypothetical protein
MTPRDWKIFCWALIHSPHRVEIECQTFWFSFNSWVDEIYEVSFTFHFPPKIYAVIPHAVRAAYEERVERSIQEQHEPNADEIPF